MENTQRILNFTSLVYSLTSIEDRQAIIDEINDFFSNSFTYLDSFIFLVKNSNEDFSVYYGGEVPGKKDIEEFGIIIRNFFPNIEKSPDIEASEKKQSRSVLFLPFVNDRECLGLAGLYLNQKISQSEKASLSKIVMDLIGVLLEKTRNISSREKAERLASEYNREMETAFLLHKKIIPDPEIDMDCIAIHAKYRPYKLIGGDYYNLLRISDSKYLTVLGDAAGKGMAGALISNMFHVILKYITMSGDDFSFRDMLMNINDFMCSSIDSYHFIATLFIYSDFEKNTCTVCNCGHYAPVFFDSESTTLIDRSNPPMGIAAVPEWNTEQFEITDGLKFCFFTDGFAETFEDYNRTVAMINEFRFLSIDNLVNLLYSKLNINKASDDVTLVAGQMHLRR
ncbi:MAG: PP2C family protein-serine/threonine phosphatase [Candidatus Muiribacteriaceae bacterium]